MVRGRMNTRHLLTVSCAALVALHSSVFAGGEGWVSDFSAAKKEAAESKKDMLVDFTGSDWCGWCIKLVDEVFKHDAFKEGVKDKFVLVELDFPKDKSKLSEATQKQNEELSEKYGIRGFPTIYLMDAKGRPYARTGYQEGGPEKYVAHLDELRATKAKTDAAFVAAEKLEGVAKATALVEALNGMELEPAVVSDFYGDVIEAIKKADPEDKTGYVKTALVRVKLEEFQMKLNEFAMKQDFDGAVKLVDETMTLDGLEKDEVQRIAVTKALIFAEQQKWDEAIKALDEAKAIAPESEIIGGMNQMREQLVNEQTKAAEQPKEEGAKDEEKEG